MFQAASAHSNLPDAPQAAAACIAQLEAAGLDGPHLVIVHANSALPLEDIGQALRARWPAVRLHAATSCLGAMTDAALAMGPDSGLAMLAIRDPGGEYGVAAGDLEPGAEATGARLAQQALQDAGRAGEIPALVLVATTPGEEEAFLGGVQSVVGASTPIIGGSAADNRIRGDWRVLDGTRAGACAAVVSVLFPSVAVCAAFESGYAPTESRGTITRAAGRRVMDIDGQPAADVYARWTDGAVRRPAEGSDNVLMASALSPLGRVAGILGGLPLYALSHPETMCADGSLTLFTQVAEGEELVLMRGTTTTLVDRAGSVVRSACRIGDLDPARLSALVMYYCGGCMLQVADRMEAVQRSIEQAAPGVPRVVGFTFGEQGPLALGPVQHGNLMISAIVFGR